MLPRFLSLTSIALTLTTSAAKSLPRLDILDQAPIVQPSPHEVILPCAKCAFSEDSKCSEVIDRDSYLTINFSTENNTLLANQDAIFPSALPLEISAIRHSGSGQDEQVRLSYALETRPIPRSPDAELGDVYLLKLKLLDAFGRRASDHVIMVGLTTSGSASESRPESDSLTITELSTSPLPPPPPPPPYHHHHSRPHPNDNINTAQSWLHAIKTTTKEYIHLLVHPYPPPPPNHRHYHQYPSNSTSPSTSNSQDNANANAKDDKSPDSKSKDPHRTLPHHNYRSHHPSWHGHGLHRGFGRIVKPVLLPAVLGAAAGVMACVVGFVVGRVVICVYRCVRGRMARGKDKGEVMGMSIGMGMDMGNGRMVRVPVVLRQGVDLDGYGRGDAGERERLLREFVIKDEDDVEDERWGV